MTIRLEDAINSGWKLESEGNLAGKAKWHWETWVSPDEEYMATFWTDVYTAEVERYE